MAQGPNADTSPPRPPAAPTRSRRLGCWGVGLVTCGSLVLIFAVLLGLTLWTGRGFWSQAVRTGQELAQCTPQLHALHGAIERYRKAEGRYPSKLLDLHPRFISRRSLLHCPADTKPADAVSYQYTPPAANAPPDADLLTCRHHRIHVNGRDALYLIRVLRNGEIRQNTTLLTP